MTSPDGGGLILASSSPRRRELLARTGVVFDVRSPDVDETPREDEEPVAYVERIARAKVMAVPLAAGDVVVAADTTVACGGQIFGKPRDSDDARRMLLALSGGPHDVHTAVAVRSADRLEHDVASTRVTFAPIAEADLEWYLATGEPLDRAGAYAVQGGGGLFVRALDGDPAAVVGLPLSVVAMLLSSVGRPLADFRPMIEEDR